MGRSNLDWSFRKGFAEEVAFILGPGKWVGVVC